MWSDNCGVDTVETIKRAAANSTSDLNLNESKLCFQSWHFGLTGLGVGILVYFAIHFFLLPRLRAKLDRLQYPKKEFTKS